ncbi:hypothetical protein [Fibrivirga algicola]|uniref:Uncharacterized protein n=1 Tax=Fibrivirga algicola TaxID=2950420 RepID=A0ABX0QEH5_9BACT|nr:hypothetical protein [Fibrivirga algicola]NID09377.1 hypothetical protein [Fibrivirga algicola]
MHNTDRIQVPISPAPYTGHGRAAKHRFFGVTADLNMLQQVDVIHVNPQGVPIHELIDADASLTDEQKELAKAQYPTRAVSKTTDGAFCDPQTGAIVAEKTPGAVPQREFFQNITVAQMMAMTGTTTASSFAQVLYTMLAGEIQKIDARGGL